MVDRQDVGSWLDGPRARTGADQAPGVRLGMPAEGPGSIARFGRRLVAILVDWLVANLVASLLLGFTYASGAGSWKPLLVLFVMSVLLLSTSATTIGQRLVGLHLERLGGGRASLVQVVVRTLLLCLAVPALIWDRDGRGLHDRAASTVLVRS